MRNSCAFVFAAVLLGLALVPAGLAQDSASPGELSLGEFARRFRAERPLTAPAETRRSRVALDHSYPGAFCRDVASLVQREKFDDLDRMAARARSSQQVFAPGGEWKLYVFYRGAAGACAGDTMTDGAWASRLNVLHKWHAMRPASGAAAVALATAYMNFAWRARAEQVSAGGPSQAANLFAQQTQSALEVLQQARVPAAAFPEWYLAMQGVGRGQGWDRGRMNSLFEEAVRVQPHYPYFYVEEALFLSAIPGGNPAGFAQEIARRIGGAEGAMTYFRVADAIDAAGAAGLEQFAWPELQQGYAALEKEYGVSQHRLNEFARMAVLEQDRDTARATMLSLGENWDLPVWNSRERFEQARTWAFSIPRETVGLFLKTRDERNALRGARYADELTRQFLSLNRTKLDRCEQRSADAVTAFSLFLKVRADGQMAEAVAWPPTSLSGCLLARLRGQRFAAPPKDGEWVMMDLGTRAFVPSLVDFAGKAKEELRPYPGTPAVASAVDGARQ